MKFIIVILFLNVIYSFSQNSNLIYLRFDNNSINYNTRLKKLKLEDKYVLFSQVKSLNANFTIVNKRLTWVSGFSFMKINFSVTDLITNWNYIVANSSGSGGTKYDTIYIKFNDPIDYHSKSLNFGINNEILLNFKPINNKVNHGVGFRNKLFFIEKFTSAFVTEDETLQQNGNLWTKTSSVPFTLSIYKNSNFYISNINVESFYKIKYFTKKNISFGVEISLGTNLYSDWDQFKKYAWLGVGLELGFGNKPLFKQKEK